MSSVNVSIKAKKLVTIQDDFGHLLPIDATINEDHSRSAQATSHEIEGGDIIADHVIKKGTQLTLTGIISEDAYPQESRIVGIDDTPPQVSAWTGERLQQIGSGAFAGMAGSLVGGGISGAVVTGAYSKLSGSLLQKASEQRPTSQMQYQPIVRVKDAYDILDQIYENKIPVLIITGLTAYQNMIMESLSMPRNIGTTRALFFTASFRRVNFVFSESVVIPAMKDKQTADRGTPKKSLGTQQSKTISSDSPVAKKGGSLLFKIGGNAAKSLFGL
ncbi:MAG: phage baseplate protein [bacterium]